MNYLLANAIKSHAAFVDETVGTVKYGIVKSVNPATCTARVLIQPDGVLSGWLPILSSWVGSGWGMVCLPSPDDQVVIAPQEGDMEQGIILGHIFSKAQVPPNAPVGELWLIHKSGSSLKLQNDGTVQITGDLHVNGDVYDKTGSLARLRNHYNAHVHLTGSGASTTGPNPMDTST
jgi:phage baseplate assembly protein gpV